MKKPKIQITIKEKQNKLPRRQTIEVSIQVLAKLRIRNSLLMSTLNQPSINIVPNIVGRTESSSKASRRRRTLTNAFNKIHIRHGIKEDEGRPWERERERENWRRKEVEK